MFDSNQPYEMICEEAWFLMIPVWVNDPGVSDKEREAFEVHLLTCSACAEEYEETKKIVSLAREHWGPISEETWKLLGQAERPIQLQNQRSLSRKHTKIVEDGWEDLKRRIPELAQLEKRRKHLQLFRRISAVAACLVIGVFVWLVFSIYSKPEIAQESVPEQAAFAPKSSIKIELLSDNSNVIIPAGTEIKTTARELKTLVINGKHRMVMNADTSLSIEPFNQNGRLGCMAKLASGEIFAHVEHDGNPFVVNTAHGRTIITGTAFDVKVTDISTTLIVTEGTVQFESEKAVVEVAAGQKSKIVGQSAPTMPVLCNTTRLTAWAIVRESKTALAKKELESDAYDFSDLWLSAISDPIDIEAIDYDDWVEEKHDWFKREFPWIFELKDALTKEGIDVDYPELLIKSGDIWQFTCLEISPTRFSVINLDSLRNTTSVYGFDKQWLMENVTAAKYAMEKSVLSENAPAYLEAFEQWLSCFDKAKKLDVVILSYSLYANVYLIETRTLILFGIKNGKYSLTAKDRDEMLALLQKEVNTACECQNSVINLLLQTDIRNHPCNDKNQRLIEGIIRNIETIMNIEKRLCNAGIPFVCKKSSPPLSHF